MPPAWWVEPLVSLCGTGLAVGLLILLMSQPEDASLEDKPKDAP
jgi:hypothetical protein